eukprot:TRINITY_DN1115_c0_g1_i12.p1 TRINITY_DN1115_c0_g1~~TRINITY_DN1115_c0_g1_i12.p1  ORF type:complete len:287 (+),score=87.53 TRINITY_DN1115_c0_g1_i12:115-975(+)
MFRNVARSLAQKSSSVFMREESSSSTPSLFSLSSKRGFTSTRIKSHVTSECEHAAAPVRLVNARVTGTTTGPKLVPFAAAAALGGRPYSTAVGDSSLLKALKAEFQHEEESYEVPQEVKAGPPEPFEVEDKKGAAELRLKAKFGIEEVKVVAALQPFPENFEDEDEEVDEEDEDYAGKEAPLPVRVSVSKENEKASLDFDCALDGKQWVVNQVRYDVLKGDEESIPYDGPDYVALDESLKAQFNSFLRKRGCTAELARFLRQGVQHKEQQEYMRWLRNVAGFVAAK